MASSATSRARSDPRPRWVVPPRLDDARTFGVVLDTSGSMDRTLLAKALGAIASYSLARDVPAARVVFCDAVAYDQGYLPPEAIADVVRVRGRGGTVLQPGIDLLERATDFPKEGPILVITDGLCDTLRIRRDHAFLIPHEDRVFIHNEQGELIIARLSPEGYEETSRALLVEPTREVRRRMTIWSHPAFAMKSVFARNDREIVRVSLAAD